MSRDLVVVGAGGFGREVLGVIRDAGVPGFQGFLDDGAADQERLGRLGARLLGGVDQLSALGADYLIGIGSPEARRRIDLQATTAGLLAASVRHPSAHWQADSEAGPGLVVCAHVSVTTNVRIGRHAHLNLHATVGHDCTFGDYVTVNPGANISGGVTLGDGVTVGTGAAIIQGVTVGAGAVIGAGAVVIRDVEEGATVVGSPARPIRR